MMERDDKEILENTAESGAENQEIKETHKEKHHHKGKKHEDELMREIENLKAENEKLQSDIVNWKDTYARKVAEFDNYKRRVMKDMEGMRLASNKDLILEIIPVYDNFHRALENSQNNEDFKTLFEGLKIIFAQMSSVFEKLEVKPIESIGAPFDHNLHEALMMEEREGVEHAMTVVEELEKGYMLGDTVLKHSKVKVAKKKAADA